MVVFPANTEHKIESTAIFDSITISEGAYITAPEGKLITMTVDSIEVPIKPGVYENAVLTVTDSFSSPVEDFYNKNYRAALYKDANGIDLSRSVTAAISGGSFDENGIRDAAIISENDNFNGVIVTDGDYNIKNLAVKMTGYGENDFCGKGAAVLVCGNSKAVLDGLKIENRGTIRSAVVVGDRADVTVKNADIMAYGGQKDEEQKIRDVAVGFAMTGVPWVLGLTGSSRATNVVSRASVTYEDSVIRAEGWGVLSTDAVDVPEKPGDYSVRLTARNSLVEITGVSGYGSYSIGPCKNTFDHCEINVPDYALIVANEYASGEFINGTIVNSGRFGVMWHQNQGGVLKVKNSTFNTGLASFLVKGCYPVIEVENSVLNAGNKVILQLMDTDDPGLMADMIEPDTAVAEKIDSHDNAAPNYADAIMFGTVYENYCTDMSASFKDMKIAGDFYNSTKNASGVGMVMGEGKPGEHPEGPEESGEPGGFMPPPVSTKSPINLILEFDNAAITGVISASSAKHAVPVITEENRIELGQVTNTACPAVNNGVILTLKNKSAWVLTGECFLTALAIDSSSSISGAGGKVAALYIDGVQTDIAPGTYKGNIKLVPMD